tara:strand:+ start:513 stop:980 length:468 start_codon:yes stop_codon:yes gene_type:complete
MSAFDTAWALLKMPIVPGSFRSFNPLGLQTAHVDAMFNDPETKDSHPIEISMGEDIIEAKIKNALRLEGFPLANATFRRGTDSHGISQKDFSSEGSETKDQFQRRGYMSALYDIVSTLLAQRNENLVPDHIQTPDGESFWEVKGGKHVWPVRDDL